jgi:hypothetical protein
MQLIQHITENTFKNFVKGDPAWAATVEEPTQIHGQCMMMNSNISDLSPFLHFSQETYFQACKELKIASGTFDKWVNFEGAGIEEVKDLKFTKSERACMCNLTDTPYFKKHPLEAAEVMTGSADPNVWESVANIMTGTSRSEKLREGLRMAIELVKKQKLAAHLKGKRERNALEI